MRGFAIHFPELHFELPTIQFPCLVNYRRNPEMYMDGGRAPLVQGAPAAYGPIMGSAQFGPGVTATPIGAPAAAPAAAPALAAPAAPDCSAPPAVPDCSAPPPVGGCVEDVAYEDDLLNELAQARRELSMYRAELQRLKTILERVVDEPEVVAEAPAVAPMAVPAARSKPRANGRSTLATEGQRQRSDLQPGRNDGVAAVDTGAAISARPARKNVRQAVAVVEELPSGPPVVRSSKRTAYRPGDNGSEAKASRTGWQ
jgi:hypothetical protein